MRLSTNESRYRAPPRAGTSRRILTVTSAATSGTYERSIPSRDALSADPHAASCSLRHRCNRKNRSGRDSAPSTDPRG
ncbi:hypothetical protein H4W34_003028 [Actinomadura algeriensis]|uniref:Uncharacterized protein n=1 Tax=Actinomadura algeriensis TaxID=1679523 RepID=A0ABR9JRJ3_9ACTN|nr:hypothetical protein [Actinomadura algeriensis]